MHTDPSTAVEMKTLPPKTLPKSKGKTLVLPLRLSFAAEVSGAPFPKANQVTPATSGKRCKQSDRVSSCTTKNKSAVETNTLKTSTNQRIRMIKDNAGTTAMLQKWGFK